MTILFEDEWIKVIFQPSENSSVVVLSFCDLGFVNKGRSKTDLFWGSMFFEKSKISAIGFVAKGSPNWFPIHSILSAVDKVNEVTASFEKRITYGNSMGGYAALKYGRLFNATVALSFSPQYSIDPSVVSGFDVRFARYYRKAVHSGMEIKADDLPCSSYVFFDPFYPSDKGHVDLLKQVDRESSVKLVPALLTAHATIVFLAGGELIQKLFSDALAGNHSSMKKTVCVARRRSNLRSYAASFDLTANERYQFAEKILRQKYDLISTSHKVELIRMLALGFKKKGMPQSAHTWLMEWVVIAPHDVHAHLALANVCIDLGDHEGAAKSVDAAKLIAPTMATVMITDGIVKEKSKRVDDAYHVFKNLISDASVPHESLVASATFFQRNGQFSDAVEAFERAVLLRPDHILSLQRLVDLHSQRRSYHAALDYAEKLVELQHDNKNCVHQLNMLKKELGL